MKTNSLWGRNTVKMGLVVLLGLPLVYGCRPAQEDVRTYREITVRPPETPVHPPVAQSAPQAKQGQAEGTLRWDTPEGWTEAAGSGMRVASFTMSSADGAGECSLIMLGGNAGGLEANIKRWAGQVELTLPAQDQCTSFVEKQERFTSPHGFPVVLVDLTGLTEEQAAGSNSMLAGVITLGSRTLFAKFTGPVALLNSERVRLSAFCRSLRIE
jgi:hypothetical protein